MNESCRRCDASAVSDEDAARICVDCGLCEECHDHPMRVEPSRVVEPDPIPEVGR
jgi:hypothetical protein